MEMRGLSTRFPFLKKFAGRRLIGNPVETRQTIKGLGLDPAQRIRQMAAVYFYTEICYIGC
jgi:hypothetical protein